MRVVCRNVGGGALLDIHRCSINTCKIRAECNYNGHRWSADSGTRALAF